MKVLEFKEMRQALAQLILVMVVAEFGGATTDRRKATVRLAHGMAGMVGEAGVEPLRVLARLVVRASAEMEYRKHQRQAIRTWPII